MLTPKVTPIDHKGRKTVETHLRNIFRKLDATRRGSGPDRRADFEHLAGSTCARSPQGRAARAETGPSGGGGGHGDRAGGV
jgi:hypothetical protein